MLPVVVVWFGLMVAGVLPVHVSVSPGWNVAGILLDIEHAGMAFVSAEPGPAFDMHAPYVHASVNAELQATCKPCGVVGERLRFLVLAYGPPETPTDETLPVALLHFEGSGPPVGLTCTVRELDCDGWYVTYRASAVLVNEGTGELWEVSEGFPETGTLQVGSLSSVEVKSHTWQQVKELYR